MAKGKSGREQMGLDPIELDFAKVKELFASLPKVDFDEVDRMADCLRAEADNLFPMEKRDDNG